MTNTNNCLTPHETLELHELISSEVTEAKKLHANMETVKDNELKSFMQNCLNNKKNNIQAIEQFINSQQNQSSNSSFGSFR